MKKRKEYLVYLLALLLGFGLFSVQAADPLKDAAQEESSNSADNHFAEEVKNDFNGHYVGESVDLRFWPEGDHFAGELKYKEVTYPVLAEAQAGGLSGRANAEGKRFTFVLKKKGEKYLMTVGNNFQEELERREFPILVDSYEGEKGTKVQIQEKKEEHYSGTIEFKGKKMPFEGDVKGGVLDGTITSGSKQLPFTISKEEKDLHFQTGSFKDVLAYDEEKALKAYMVLLQKVWKEGKWAEVVRLATCVEELEVSGAENMKLKEQAATAKARAQKKIETARQESEKLEGYLSVARQAVKDSKWVEAVQAADRALQLKKDLKEAADLKAVAEKQIGSLIQSGLKAAAEAKEKRDWQQVSKEASNVLWLKPEQEEAKKYLKEAKENLERLAKIEEHLNAAEAALMDKSWIAAQDEVNMVLELDPNNAEAKRIQTEVRGNLARIERALEEARKASEQKDWAKLKEKSTAVLALDPNNAEVESLQEEAENQLKEAEEHLQLAKEAELKKNWGTVRKEIDLVLELDPNNAEAKRLMADAKGNLTRIERALDEVRKASEQKDWAKLKEKCAAALVLDPNNEEVKSLQKEAEVQIKEAEKHLNAAKAANQKKDRGSSEKETTSVLELDRNSAKIKGEKSLTEVEKFGDELKKGVFPDLESVYNGKKGTKVRISKKTGDHYIGTIEFKGKKMNFAADVMGGVLAGKIKSGKSQIDFKIYKEAEKLIFQTGTFTDELVSGKVIISKLLKEAYSAKENKNWDKVKELAKNICEIDPDHKEAQNLLSEAMEIKAKPEKIAKLLEEAREAKENKNWKVLENAINQILELESTNEEAKKLYAEAKEERDKLNLTQKTNEVEDRKNSDQVDETSKKVLSTKSDNTEALKPVKLGQEEAITNLLKEAKEAKENKNWEVVRSCGVKILDLKKDHLEAMQLKKEAEEELKPQNMIVLLREKVTLEMIGIKPGTFIMGSPKGELGRQDDEPQHQVTLTKGYWLGKYEVTQDQWKAVMKNNPSKKHGTGSNYPVYNVSKKDAMEFCRKLTEQERSAGRLPAGYEYTLPTEAQWEYACRAETNTALNSGKDLTAEDKCDEIDEVGWYVGNMSTYKVHPVGQKQANAWGLYDMHGNIEEWCLDSCDYEDALITDTYSDEIKDPLCKTGSYGVTRGGSWIHYACYCRSASRGHYTPISINYFSGFRLALVPVQ